MEQNFMSAIDALQKQLNELKANYQQMLNQQLRAMYDEMREDVWRVIDDFNFDSTDLENVRYGIENGNEVFVENADYDFSNLQSEVRDAMEDVLDKYFLQVNE